MKIRKSNMTIEVVAGITNGAMYDRLNFSIHFIDVRRVKHVQKRHYKERKTRTRITIVANSVHQTGRESTNVPKNLQKAGPYCEMC